MKRTPLAVLGICIALILVLSIAAVAVANWAPNTNYAVGALVMYNGVEYKCIQAHTSEVGWEPPNAPALWQVVSGNPGPTPTATSTPAPGCTPMAITPYIKVGSGAWVQSTTATVSAGSSVTFGPQPTSGGTWSWTGPNGFTSTSRQITITINSTSSYTATFNENGCRSSATFTVTVNGSKSPTPTPTHKPTATPTPVSGGKTINNVYVTFYGWWDNSPPGNAIAYPKNGGNPTLHNVATAGGTASNPSSFASDSKDGEFQVGDVIYVPYLKKYFINEDECIGSGPPVAGTGNCEADWEKNREYHVDLWLGGNPPSNENDVLNCEDSMTTSGPVATIILHPPSNEPVDTTPLYNSSTNKCEGITPP